MKSPVLLLTLGRSGGTWVKNILDQSPDLAMAGEMHIINPMTPRFNFIDWFSYVKKSENPQNALIKILLSEKIFGSFWHEFEDYLDYSSLIKYLNNNELTNPIKFIEDILVLMAKSKGKQRWGIHYPVHPTKVCKISEWWPDSKIIYLDRHPCAIVASRLFHTSTVARKRKYWLIKPLIHYGLIFYVILNYILASRAIDRAGNCVVIKYEELMISPNKSIKKLFGFCDISYALEMIETEGKESSFDGKKKGHDITAIHRWHSVLTEFEKNIILNLTRSSRKIFDKYNLRHY